MMGSTTIPYTQPSQYYYEYSMRQFQRPNFMLLKRRSSNLKALVVIAIMAVVKSQSV